MAYRKDKTLPYEDMLKLSDRELLDYSLTGESPSFVYTKPPKREGVYDAEDIRSEVAAIKGKTDYTNPLSKGVRENNVNSIGNVNAKTNSISDYVLKDRMPQTPTFSNTAMPQYSPYNSRYQADIDNILNSIVNADKFSYDAANDDLFKYYAKEYQKAGDLAARDSMGRAMASSGGFGNTYAQTVAQQVQNDYNSQLTDMIPEFEQNAYSRYIDELSRQQNNLGLLMDAEKNDYNRYLDALSQQNYLNELAYEREQDALAQQNYLDELALAQLEAEAKAKDKTKDEGTTDDGTGKAVSSERINEMISELGGAGRVFNDLNYTDPMLHDNMEMMNAIMQETKPLDTSKLGDVSKLSIYDVRNILEKLSDDSMRRNALLQLEDAGLSDYVFETLSRYYKLV